MSWRMFAAENSKMDAALDMQRTPAKNRRSTMQLGNLQPGNATLLNDSGSDQDVHDIGTGEPGDKQVTHGRKERVRVIVVQHCGGVEAQHTCSRQTGGIGKGASRRRGSVLAPRDMMTSIHKWPNHLPIRAGAQYRPVVEPRRSNKSGQHQLLSKGCDDARWHVIHVQTWARPPVPVPLTCTVVSPPAITMCFPVGRPLMRCVMAAPVSRASPHRVDPRNVTLYPIDAAAIGKVGDQVV